MLELPTVWGSGFPPPPLSFEVFEPASFESKRRASLAPHFCGVHMQTLDGGGVIGDSGLV
jgi:hypothetical protein